MALSGSIFAAPPKRCIPALVGRKCSFSSVTYDAAHQRGLGKVSIASAIRRRCVGVLDKDVDCLSANKINYCLFFDCTLAKSSPQSWKKCDIIEETTTRRRNLLVSVSSLMRRWNERNKRAKEGTTNLPVVDGKFIIDPQLSAA